MADIRELLSLLRSDDAETRASAVERAAVTVERLIHGLVEAIESAGEHDHYLVEHIHRFGPSMVVPIEGLLERSGDPDTRVLCALLLLRLKSRTGSGILVEAVHEGSDWLLPAASRLAEAGVLEAAPAMVHQLRSLPLERKDEIVGLLRALQALDGRIPADLATRFAAPEAPAQAREIVQQALRLTTAE